MNLKQIILTALCLIMTGTLVMAKEIRHEGQGDMQAMMEVYAKLATPGPPHKLLGSMVGTWQTVTKSWMEPQKPPIESTGTCEQKMVLDGRFLHQKCTGDFMGSPFTGIGVTGYDNNTKKYVSIWMDTMGTGIYFFEGTASEDGKTITQKSQYDDPIEGPMELRSVSKIVDNNTEIFEMYGTGKSGQERKMMEITYTRKP